MQMTTRVIFSFITTAWLLPGFRRWAYSGLVH